MRNVSQTKYGLIGILVGMLFVAGSWGLDIWLIGGSPSFVSIVSLYINNPLHFAILTAALVIGGLGLGIDMLERRAKRYLTKSELRYHVALDKISDGVITMDKWGAIASLNPAAALLFGYEPGEAVGRKTEILMPEKYRPSYKKGLEHYFSGKGSKIVGGGPVELEGLKKSGEVFSISISLNDFTIGGDRLVTGIVRDITGEKQLPMETAGSAADLTRLIDTSNAPIFGIDPEGRVNEWNQTTAKISGFDKAEVMGRELVVDFITEEYKESVDGVFAKALRGDDTVNFEFPLYTKDKQRVDVLLNATARRDVEGNIVGVIGVGQDITLLKQKEFALQQAQKMEAVGQLTGGIAHDFNNLLSIVQGNLRFLEGDIGEVSDDIKLLFADALSAVEDGSELTARLLRFSSNRNLEPMTKEVNVTIENFHRLVIRTIGDKISVVLKLTEEELFVRVNPSQFENTLLNLVINARDAMPKGGEVIIMSEPISYAEAKRIAGQYDVEQFHNQEFVKISVHDPGEGIPRDIISQIIDPFFTTKEAGAGTGLGLSMVDSFVKTSSGFLRINSEVGEGTIVEMCFPSMPKPKDAPSKDVTTSRESIFSKTILVVEDEPRVRRVAVRTLRELNYKIIEAENADMAMSIIESGEEIELVFSDILMPGDKDGRMLGDWVTEHYPAMKVVLTSGYSKGKGDERNPLHDENLTKYPIVRKPYRQNALADIIQAEWDDN